MSKCHTNCILTLAVTIIALDESVFILQSMHSTNVGDIYFQKISGENGTISLLGNVILQCHSFFGESVVSLGRIYLPTPSFNFTFVLKQMFFLIALHILLQIVTLLSSY